MNLFLPSHTKKVLSEAELIYTSLQRNRVYSQDILSARDLEAILAIEAKYPALIKLRDVDGLEKLNKDAMKLGVKLFPPSPWDGWRENVEVFVVAAIMALAIRTYFLQPFKIPTGSMEPTLLGIEPKPATETPPNIVYQAYDFLIHGKTYSRVVTKQGGKIVDLNPGSMTIWFEYTDVTLEDDQGNRETDRLWIRLSDVEQKLNIYLNGTPDLFDGHIHNEVYKPGDQVLVDKVTYNFRPPRPGEVIIFKTSGIPGLANERGPDQEGSEDFIKRCVAMAGDRVKVLPPCVYVNDQLAQGASTFAKEFARKDGYPGYTLVRPFESSGVTDDTNRPFDPYDSQNSQTYYVPADCYWAMGDNSPNSKDSRYWGGVPRQNLVGRGYFVFWPFTSRWGWIK